MNSSCGDDVIHYLKSRLVYMHSLTYFNPLRSVTAHAKVIHNLGSRSVR